MSMSEPFSPRPDTFPEDIHDDLELHVGPLDGPDVLEDEPEQEPSLDSIDLSKDVPFRAPHAGERLTAEQLEDDLAKE